MGGRKVQKRGEHLKRKNRLRVRVRRARAKQRFFAAGSAALFLLLLTLLFGKGGPFDRAAGNFAADADRVQEEDVSAPKRDGERDCEGELVLTYLDVGQADCTILQCGEHAMMIDGGGRSTSQEVLAAARGLGITQFDYIVATHGHEDHIGGLPAVLDAFSVETVIFRKEENDSRIYGEFEGAVAGSGAAVISPEPGLVFGFGDATVQILAPGGQASDTNNGSVALMVAFGERKFLFTGDAQAESEKGMTELGFSLEADVFQAGHHGSQTSNTEAFLEAADPVYVVISCGAGNEYGHPHSEVIARFEEMDVQIYRTDTMGTVTVRTDGKSLEIATQRK